MPTYSIDDIPIEERIGIYERALARIRSFSPESQRQYISRPSSSKIILDAELLRSSQGKQDYGVPTNL